MPWPHFLFFVGCSLALDRAYPQIGKSRSVAVQSGPATQGPGTARHLPATASCQKHATYWQPGDSRPSPPAPVLTDKHPHYCGWHMLRGTPLCLILTALTMSGDAMPAMKRLQPCLTHSASVSNTSSLGVVVCASGRVRHANPMASDSKSAATTTAGMAWR